ncbi:sigma factor-like helix-turn-helix DNA-binding protein [Frigidibacter sp.]|uniref:sigma factor-like helix-turn-helix DNA-binding protein n=1 Tax=Frigidibacter sp. TaxID=2586418 RepID=UPI002732FA99|nr:sigma factor-like helix-turn-helix DNA-binding protein [Frigidibacter sp.]MDP3338844.1 sigma factor-like helix-turn-helix DNA-binding protein [Frigidibacter sp.]
MTHLDDIRAMIPSLRRFARALVQDRAAADDLVQRCLEVALAQGAPGQDLRGWLFGLLLGMQREGEAPAPLARLPEDQRLALLLVAVEGLTLAEAATALEVSEGALVSRLGRAREMLREGPRPRSRVAGKAALGDIALLAWRYGRLSADEEAGFPARLAADPAAQATLAEWDRQDAALALLHPVVAEPVPERMLALFAKAPVRQARPRRWRPIAAALALLAMGAAGGWGAAWWMQPRQTAELPMLAALRAHDAYADVARPAELGSERIDYVTGWLSTRLGRPFALPDLGAFGFHPVGGRLLPDASGTAAVLVYENGPGERLTLFAAPQPGTGGTAFGFLEEGATRGVWWAQGGFGYAVAGEIAQDVLRKIAIAAKEQLS